MQHLGDTGTVKLGYTLAKEFWGRGYATEAARACVNYAFQTPGYRGSLPSPGR